ncbi:MAG TPA: hypothetical protein VGM82_00210 [Gemmatimonadaceae bacterium]
MASLKVNAQQWNSLSDDERTTIKSILADTGLAAHGDITPDASATLDSVDGPESTESIFCTIACNVAEAAAVAACTAATGGVALTICLAAAHAAGDLCRSKC